MNENINLCEILKGHEGETFYSPLYGDVIIKLTTNGYIEVWPTYKVAYLPIASNGHHYDNPNKGEILVFPSKDQRNWIKWDKENNKRTPKTWSEFVKSNYYTWSEVIGHLSTKDESIYKSIFALLKIHQLIEVGYGGNVTNEEWEDETLKKWIISFDIDNKLSIDYTKSKYCYVHIAFHTEEQAKEFFSYPENVRLLRDYFLV